MNGAAASAVECRGLDLDYDDVLALRGVDLRVAAGEVVALLGPSGSGKTTLLYAIAGFLPVTTGQISLEGEVVSAPDRWIAPEQRSVAMVFQHYGLWPHLDAQDTVAYPLRRQGLDVRTARAQARGLLGQLHIEDLAARKPGELSGGEQQRVGLARALARRPAVYLLDEPTAHLDMALKADLQGELIERVRADGAAVMHATHDVEEALAVADRVVLLRDGRIVQDAEPETIYTRPADAWAARLTGPCVFIDGEVVRTSAGHAIMADGTSCPLGPDDPAPGIDPGPGTDPAPGTGRFLVRPDWVTLDGPLPGVVQAVRYGGTYTEYRLETPLGQLLARALGPPRLAAGSATTCGISQIWRVSAGA